MKNKRPLVLLLSANAISGFAQGITMLSIPWYFAGQGESSLFMFLYAIVTLGSLFWGLYAGALIDGFNRRDVFLGTNFIEGLIILSIATLGFTEGSIPSLSLIVMVFGTTFFGYIIHYPNLYAFAQEVSDKKDYARVTSLIEVIGQATVIGAAGFGVFLLEGFHVNAGETVLGITSPWNIHINRWELHEIFLLDGLTYIVSFVVICFIRYTPPKNLSQMDEGNLGERLRTGYEFLKKNKLVTLFGVCSYSIFIVLLVERFALLPLYVKGNLEAKGSVLSFAEVMYAGGSLLSGVIAGRFLSRLPIPKSIIIFVMITSVGFFVSFLIDSVVVFYLISFLFGIANAGSRIFRITYLFMLVPNEITGRVNSMFNVITTALRLVFLLTFMLPFFSEGNHVTWAYFILGMFTLITGIILIVIYKKILDLTEKSAAKAHDRH